jgi:hypothetical protein
MTSDTITHVALAALAAVMLAGCGVNWRGTTWDRQLACESFGGHYGDGDCHYSGP